MPRLCSDKEQQNVDAVFIEDACDKILPYGRISRKLKVTGIGGMKKNIG